MLESGFQLGSFLLLTWMMSPLALSRTTCKLLLLKYAVASPPVVLFVAALVECGLLTTP